MRGRLFFLFVMLMFFSGLSGQVTTAQSPDFIYSENKGHTISGAFLDYYLLSPNPKEIHGEPITEAFTDPKTDLLVQYFEKSRFEYHPTEPTGRQVHLSPLGLTHFLLVQNLVQPSNVFDHSQGCRVFQDTGLKICLAFLAYYEANGAEYTFGPPVSNAVWHNGRLVQYFFYSKLEWHPDLPAGKSIKVANLGYENFFKNREDSSRLDPIPLSDNNIISNVLSLNARAAVEQAITTTQGRQSVHILVTDQRRLPVAGAQVVVVLKLPSGEESRYIVPQVTDQHGVTQFTFSFDSSKVGMAEIRVIVTRDHLETKTKTSFRIWW